MTFMKEYNMMDIRMLMHDGHKKIPHSMKEIPQSNQ